MRSLQTVFSEYLVYPSRAAFVASGITPADGSIRYVSKISYVRQSGVTAIPDLPGWVPNGIATPEHFGAVGDGVADDTAALQACFDFADNVLLGTKTYLASARLSRIGRLSLKGDGKGKSIIKWTLAAATRGILITSSTAPGNVTIEGCELQTLASGDGTAIEILMTGQIVEDKVNYDLRGRVTLSDIAINGATSHESGDGWDIGLHVSDAMHVECRNVHVVGGYSAVPAHSNLFATAGFRITNTSNATIAQFIQCTAYFVIDGILSEAYEGLFVTDCNFVAVRTGVRTLNSVSEPQLTIKGTHVNAYETCISAGLQTYLQVISCLLYGRPDMSSATNFVFVRAGAGFSFIGAGTSMSLFGSPTTSVGVDVTAGIGHRITDCIFRNTTTAIRIASAATGVVADKNQFIGVLTRYDNSSADSALVSRNYSAAAAVTIGTTITNLVAVPIGDVVPGQQFVVYASVAGLKGATLGDVLLSVAKSPSDTCTLKVHHSNETSIVRLPGVPANNSFAQQWAANVEVVGEGTLTMLLRGTSVGSSSTVAANGEQLSVIEMT